MNGARIFIVSSKDNPQEELAESLRTEGYDVTTSGPEEGVDGHIREKRPDVVILLIEESIEEDSEKLCRELKTNQETKGIALLVISKMNGGRSVWESVNQWADDFLVKPFESQELQARLRIHLRMAEYHNKLERLVIFARKIYSSDLKGIASAVRSELNFFATADRFSIFVAEDDGRRLHSLVHNHEEMDMDYMDIPLESSLLMLQARKKLEPIFVSSFSKSSFATGEKRGKYSDDFALCVPLHVGEEFLGILNLNGNQDGFFNRINMDLVALLAEILSAAINNARRLESLRTLAITDGLTGLLNHRSFHERLAVEFERMRRFDIPLSCLMVDIDFFKKINDKHGHPAGDTILAALADKMKGHLRKIDTIARYGGEEFAILLPQTTASDAKIVAERIRNDVKNKPFPITGDSVKVTISLGISDVQDARGITASDLLGQADKALYKAKKNGRNKTIVFSDE